jgi:uncharacterized protein YjiS (DUF1127 family)
MLIMTFATKSLSSAPAGLTRLATRGAAQVTNRVTSLVKALMHRRAVMRLSELDERGLKDIGLVRSDVEGALASSWLSDPSSILAARQTSRSCVASARREEGLRQAGLKSVAAPRAKAVAANPVACSA